MISHQQIDENLHFSYQCCGFFNNVNSNVYLERNGFTTITNFFFFYSLFLPITKSTFFSPSLLQPIKNQLKDALLAKVV